jgi:hypothetical protein
MFIVLFLNLWYWFWSHFRHCFGIVCMYLPSSLYICVDVPWIFSVGAVASISFSGLYSYKFSFVLERFNVGFIN